MTSNKLSVLLGALVLTLVASNCGSPAATVAVDPAGTPVSTPSSAASSTAPSDDPKTVVTAVQQGVQIVGTSFASAALYIDLKRRSTLRDELPMALTSTLCTNDGQPKLNTYTDPNYPGYFTYCSITAGPIKNSFSNTGLGACLVSRAGLAYDGVAHQVTLTSSIVTGCMLTGLIAVGTKVTLTPSSPAAFNTNYAKGVIVDLSSTALKLYLKIATNVSGNKQSFYTVNQWGDGAEEGSAGSFDSSTGDLWYEYRDERPNTDGWTRHARMHALMTVSGTTPTGTVSLSFASSDITVTGSNLYGMLITESGAFATGLKARYWEVANPAAGAIAYDTVGNWIETPNDKCYTATSETSSGCGTGLAGFTTNTKFACNTTDSHITVANWGAAITGQTFANVDVDADTQF